MSEWLARADLAIVGGGVTLYEAVAAGVPAVAVAVSAAQQPTIRGFGALGLALDAGSARTTTLSATARRVQAGVGRLIDDQALRQRIRRPGPAPSTGRAPAGSPAP